MRKEFRRSRPSRVVGVSSAPWQSLPPLPMRPKVTNNSPKAGPLYQAPPARDTFPLHATRHPAVPCPHTALSHFSPFSFALWSLSAERRTHSQKVFFLLGEGSRQHYGALVGPVASDVRAERGVVHRLRSGSAGNKKGQLELKRAVRPLERRGA